MMQGSEQFVTPEEKRKYNNYVTGKGYRTLANVISNLFISTCTILRLQAAITAPEGQSRGYPYS